MREKKTILAATFEESRKLVDEAYVEEALKVPSNKQDRNRFWGEMVMILIGIGFMAIFGNLQITNSSFDKKLMWSQSMFNFLILCNLIMTIGFIFYALISKIKIRKTKFLRDYDFNQKAIIGLGISLISLSFIMLSYTASFLHSVVFEPLYLILDIVISYKVIIKLYDEEMVVLYGTAYQNNRAEKVDKVTDWISKNIIVLGAIIFVIKDLFSRLGDITGMLLTVFAPLFSLADGIFSYGFTLKKHLKAIT